jgi:uncharacterized protein YndB with AHSA1/START domain
MGSVLFYLVLLVAIALAALILIASRKPDTFRITRSIRIDAPASAIYPHIAGMQAFTRWSPWQAKDLAMTQSFGPVGEGVGAWQEWSGNSKVGQGRMEVVAAEPPGRIAYKLNFLKPMRAENMAEFTLKEAGGATDVAWAMTGASPFTSKIFDTLMNMDKMVGRDFEEGLANLKRLVETKA